MSSDTNRPHEDEQQMVDEADRMQERLDTLGDHIAEAAKKSDVPDRETDSDLAEDAGLGEVVEGEDVAPGDEPGPSASDRSGDSTG